MQKSNKEYALLISLGASVILPSGFYWTGPGLCFSRVEEMASGGALGGQSIKLMLQAVGITIVGQVVSRLCKDAGESALSYTVDLGCQGRGFGGGSARCRDTSGANRRGLPHGKDVKLWEQNGQSCCVSRWRFCCGGAPCQAHASELEGIYEKSGAGELYGALDQETQDLLDQAGVEEGVWEGQTGENLLKLISQLLRERLTAPLKGLASLLGIVILCRLAGNFEEGGSASVLAGTLACAGVLTAPLLELIRSAEQVIENACVFLGASVPVYSALLLASGGTVVGSSYSFLTLAAGNLISLLSKGYSCPCCTFF